MKEQFVTYEIALKLKELGFDEECLTSFEPGWNFNMPSGRTKNNSNYPKENVINQKCAAPLWQQVIDWFRKKHDVHIIFSVNPYSTDINQVYGYKIYADNNLSGLKCVINYECLMLHFIEAIERAILTAIELCKQ